MNEKIIIRPLEEQFKSHKVKRIRTIQALLCSSIYDDSVGKYYIEEINKSLEAGLWLASINLINSFLEIVIRDLLFYSLVKDLNINPSFGEDASKLQQKLENSRDPEWSFDRIITELYNRQVINGFDKFKLKNYYKKVRIPIHHGISQRFVRDEKFDNPPGFDFLGMLYGRVTWMELEEKLEIKGIYFLEKATKLIIRFSEQIKKLGTTNG